MARPMRIKKVTDTVDGMNVNEIDVEKEVKAVEDAIERGDYRHATKKENMALRLAALSAIVREMQVKVDNDRELVNA
jgi:hypothetical protein